VPAHEDASGRKRYCRAIRVIRDPQLFVQSG